jgi:hypothetical protein
VRALRAVQICYVVNIRENEYDIPVSSDTVNHGHFCALKFSEGGIRHSQNRCSHRPHPFQHLVSASFVDSMKGHPDAIESLRRL